MKSFEVQEPPRRKFASFRKINTPCISTSRFPKPQPTIQTHPQVNDGDPQNDYCPLFVVHEGVDISFST